MSTWSRSFPVASVISWAVASPFAASRATRTVVVPFAASWWAVALPIPAVAPVIR